MEGHAQKCVDNTFALLTVANFSVHGLTRRVRARRVPSPNLTMQGPSGKLKARDQFYAMFRTPHSDVLQETKTEELRYETR